MAERKKVAPKKRVVAAPKAPPDPVVKAVAPTVHPGIAILEGLTEANQSDTTVYIMSVAQRQALIGMLIDLTVF